MRFLLIFLLLAAPLHAESSQAVYSSTTIVNDTPLCARVTIFDERAGNWVNASWSAAWVVPRSQTPLMFKREDHGVPKLIRYHAQLFAADKCTTQAEMKADLSIDVKTAGGQPPKDVRLLLSGRGFKIVSP